MEIDRKRQEQAMARAKEIITNAEKMREAARVEKGIEDFLKDNFDVFGNDEFVENLASYTLDKYLVGEKELAVKIVEKLGKSLCSDTLEVRERSLMILSVFTEIILEEDFQEFRGILARILVEWLRIEEDYIAGFEIVCTQLQKIILIMLSSGEWNELENLVVILEHISTGEITKSSLIRGMAAKVHESLAEPDVLDILSNVYLDEKDERRNVAESLLVHLGRYSVTFLVEKMIYSNSKEDRLSLINLVPRFGTLSVPVLSKCLDEEPPWYVIRNIVLIISHLDDPEQYQIIEPYLTHRDMRVQQQVVNCIDTLGGKQMRKRLIQALMKVNDELKGQLIIQLGQFDGMDIGYAFLDLYELHDSFASHVHDDLLMKICVKIKFYPSQRAVSCLEELIAERKSRYGEADKISRTAAASLQAIEIKLQGEDLPDAPTGKEIMDQLAQVEEETDDLFSGDEMDQMSGGSELAETAAESAGRDQGEELPFYASQEHHLMVWSKIYEQMTPEEFDDFYGTLKPVAFQANEQIVKQGDKVTDLYLIDKGFAGVSHMDTKSEIFLTSLQAGEIIGSEGFVSGLEWSVSLEAQTELQVRVLGRDKFADFAKKYPECTARFYLYCEHYDVVPYLINLTHDSDQEPIGKDIEVRSNELLRDVSGEFASYLLAGTLEYVARGGLCLSVPYAYEENALAILGRQVSLEIVLEDDDLKRKCFGVIAGAGTHDGNARNLFLYVKFYDPLERADFRCTRMEMM
jgi:CRP-like cAMP-binding protein